MKIRTTASVLAVGALLAGCSSTPEATEAESTATATAVATATADVETPPVTTAVATATAEPTPPPPEPAADLVVTPVKIKVDAKNTIEIKADKGIYLGTKKIATFDKNTLKIEGMNDSMAVFKDGTIEMKPASMKKLKFNDKDEIEFEGGGKIALDDKGKLTMVAPGDKPPPKDFKPPVVTGFKPEGRRATSLGVLLVLFTTGASKEPAPPPVTRETSVAPTAKPSAAPAMTGAAPKK